MIEVLFPKASRNQILKLWLVVFFTLNLVFFFYQSSFFIGNHDWDWVKGTTQILSLNTGLFEGRYAKFVLNVLLFSGQILPYLNTVVSFALLALGVVLVTVYWCLPSFSAALITALMASLAPFVLGWLYFPINLNGNFAAVALVAAGLLLSERQSFIAGTLAVMLFLAALGVYPSVAEMMLVCFCFRCVLFCPKKAKECLSFVPLIASLVLFKLLLTLLTIGGFVYTGHYNMESVSLPELVTKLPQTMLLAPKQLITTLPFMPFSFKGVGLALIIGALFKLAEKRSWLCFAFFAVAFLSTALSAHLTAVPDEVAYMPRVNFYGLNFLYAGSAAVLLSAKQKSWRNFALLLGVLYIFLSVRADAEALKVWQLGKTAEENLVARVSARIEGKSTVLPLTPVMAGEISLRSRYYHDTFQKNSPYILERSFIVRHIPSGMFNFYAPSLVFNGSSQIRGLTPEMYDFLLTASRPWPAEESLYLDPNYAIILLTADGISAIQAQLPR